VLIDELELALHQRLKSNSSNTQDLCSDERPNRNLFDSFSQSAEEACLQGYPVFGPSSGGRDTPSIRGAIQPTRWEYGIRERGAPDAR